MMFCPGVHMVLESDEGLPHTLYGFHKHDLREVTASNFMLWYQERNCHTLIWVTITQKSEQKFGQRVIKHFICKLANFLIIIYYGQFLTKNALFQPEVE